MSETLIDEKIEIQDITDALYGSSLIVHNDDFNTFEFVIECLVYICNHSWQQAEQCAYIIHHSGKYAVKQGEKKLLRPMRDALVDRGISATLE